MKNLIEEFEEERQFEGEEDKDSDYKDDNAWHINLKEEKNFWNKILIPNIIYPPNYCQKYNKSAFSLNETQREDLINPYYLR